MISKRLLPVLVAALISTSVAAGESEELLKLKNTTLNLIEALVKEGILSRERADALISEAEHSAAEQASQQERKEAAGQPGVVRVPYVPEFVRQEIKDEVRSELRQDVVEDVMAQAKSEQWGLPNALPDWTRRFTFSGDIRLRGEADLYDSGNPDYTFVDYNNGTFLDSTENNYRARMRMRLGVKARVSNDLTAGIRIASGSFGNPVSTNDTLSNNFGSYELVLDQAYLKYVDQNVDRYPWMTLWGGRMPNPWFSTDLVWDRDLNFDGAAATFRYNLAGSGSLLSMDERDRTLFMTVGAFSLDNVELSSRDKWLFAGQIGTDLKFDNQSSFRLGLAYYNYYNTTGKISPISQPDRYAFTAPGFVQKGNSMFDIDPANPLTRFGLAADYDLLNLTAEYDIARFAPVHVILTGDYVENIGYDAGDIRDRLQGGGMYVNDTLYTGNPGDGQTTGYMARLTLGWPDVRLRRSWQVFMAYKYLERDAVLDAFTDSDFHLGGTNAKGWILGGSYSLLDDTYLEVRYLSANAIDEGPRDANGNRLAPYGIDVLQVDLGARF
jgi:Putative porin